MTGSLTTIRHLCSAHNSAIFCNIQPLLPCTAFTDRHCVDKFEAAVSFAVLLQRTVQFATSVLLIAAAAAAQTGCCWHRSQPSHSKYKKLRSLALITTSDKQDWLHLPSQRTTPSWEHLYCTVLYCTGTCLCHYEPHTSENTPFPLVRDSNWFVVFIWFVIPVVSL